MTGADMLPAAVLSRKAVVYVRQSTQSQVMTNLESQRRQYDLVGIAREQGFARVEIIDDDLGRSASGTVARPGFDRLVAWLCAGEVGAVLCFDASRLARNGRDWHHLLELCGLVEARHRPRRRLRPMSPQRPAAARHEGLHQRVRAGRAARPDARCGQGEGTPWRTAAARAVRLYLASRGGPRPRSRPAASRGDPVGVHPLPRTRPSFSDEASNCIRRSRAICPRSVSMSRSRAASAAVARASEASSAAIRAVVSDGAAGASDTRIT